MLLKGDIGFNRSIGLGLLIVLLHAPFGMNWMSYAQEGDEGYPDSLDVMVSETVEQESTESIEEIIVYGAKPMHSLRREVYEAEANFFDLFNSLNDHDEFDVHCYYEVPSFTRIRRHVCRANFVIEATSAESAPAFSEAVGAFNRPAVFEIRRKKEKMRELMEELVNEHPELAAALSRYTGAKQTLESEQSKRYGQ